MLFWTYMKGKMVLYRYGDGIGRSILTALPDNYEHSSLSLYQNSTSGSFIKISCNVDYKITTINYLFFGTLKVHWSILSLKDSCIHHALVIWKILIHWATLIFLMLKHFIRQYRKKEWKKSLNITNVSSEMSWDGRLGGSVG